MDAADGDVDVPGVSLRPLLFYEMALFGKLCFSPRFAELCRQVPGITAVTPARFQFPALSSIPRYIQIVTHADITVVSARGDESEIFSAQMLFVFGA